MTVLVTGGAGYIGSHVVLQLRQRGEQVLVLDNLATGFKAAVGDAELVQGDVADRALVTGLLCDRRIDTVLHFAASTVVPESVADPLKYYANNTCATRNLLESCGAAGVQHFVFSSSAAVFGMPPGGIADEDTPTAPINPYGTSKLMSEMMLHDVSVATPLRHAILRYFNVAGCDPEGRVGQSTPHATLLIKVACELATGKRNEVKLYGTDYDTPDGTCIRDYIHVSDLADAHLRALDYLRSGGASVTLNCGYGHGYSVREVLDAVARISGQHLNIVEDARRPGDPPALIARSKRLQSLFAWQPQHDNLDDIIASALAWERHPAYG